MCLGTVWASNDALEKTHKGLGGGGLTADIKRIERLCTVLDVVLSFIVENIQRWDSRCRIDKGREPF